MDDVCEIFACLDIQDCPDKLDLCDEIALLEICRVQDGSPDNCDLTFIDYQTEVECELAIDSVGIVGTTATITASNETGSVFYRFLSSDATTVLRDWSLTASYDTEAAGTYIAQIRDSFGCSDSEEFEVTA